MSRLPNLTTKNMASFDTVYGADIISKKKSHPCCRRRPLLACIPESGTRRPHYTCDLPWH